MTETKTLTRPLLALADPHANSFASVSGMGRVTQDKGGVDRLYDPAADVFFEGKDDPRLRALEVTASAGEWWDGPRGRLGHTVALVRAKLTDDEAKVGGSGVIDVR